MANKQIDYEVVIAGGGGGTAPAPRFAGHFAGIMLDPDKIDFSRQEYVLPGPSASGGMASLEGIETLLAERATQMGAELRQGVAVSGFVENADGITVLAGDQSFQVQTHMVQTSRGRLKYIQKSAKDTKRLSALFIRPDGFVAWAAESDPSWAEAEAAIIRWLGSAA